ncbi:MAG: DNA polymerase III subunit delta [Candidatus Binatia bacterium]
MKRSLEKLLSSISKGKGPSLIVLHGDDFQVHQASKAILDLLAPMESRALNLERFDGRSTPWDEIEGTLRIPPLFPGRKTVFIENAPYFLSHERKGELAEKVLQLWGEEKRDEAARLFVDLLVLDGWTKERWDRVQDPSSEPQLGQLSSGGGKRELEAIFAFCRSRGMDLGQHRMEEQHRLLELMEQGLPPWTVLLITASHVDRRIRLYRRLEEEEAVLALGVEREKSGRIRREALTEFLNRRLREAGKRIETQARDMILERAGDELWTLHQEMEKLLLYVGEDPWIRAQDVAEVFLDQGEAWVFDLTDSIGQRDTIGALGHLSRLLSQGEHPLRLLGTIASEVRRLLAARHLIEGEMRHRWRRDMTFSEFQMDVHQQGAPLLTRNPYGDYRSFQRAENFTTQELLQYLQLIYQTDIRLKSSGKSPRIVLERLILEMCRGRDGRTAWHKWQSAK